jgi:hypothetical protein
MMRTWLLAAVLMCATGWANKPRPGKPQLFVPEGEDEQNPKQKKSRLRSFQEDAALNGPEPARPFPWNRVALATVVLGIGAFVGWRYYTETAEELTAQNAKRKPTRKAKPSPDESETA